MRQYRSRLSEVEEQKSIKSAVIFGGATILVIAIVIFFGINLFSKFTNLFVNNTGTPVPQTQTILPPNLSPLSPNTNQQTIVVKGTATPNTTVKIYFNNSSDETVTDDSGSFAANISLTKGANTIYAQTVDSLGNTSLSSTKYTINYTNELPNLTVNFPQNNQTFYGDSQKTINIQGSTNANNSVTVNDRVAVVDTTGKFSLSYDLQNGDNTLKIISLDQAGNKKEIDLKVTFNP